MLFRPLTCLLLAGCLCSFSIRAESVRVQFLSLDDAEIEGIFWMQEGEITPLRIPASFLMDPLMMNREMPLILYQRIENVAAEENPWRELTRLTFPEALTDAVVLLQSVGDRLTTAIVPITDRQFPEGSYMMFNRTTRAIMIALNDEVSRIPPQSMRVIRPAVEQRRPMPVYFRAEGDEENKTLVTTTWFHNPANREFVFLSSPGIEIRVRSVSRHKLSE